MMLYGKLCSMRSGYAASCLHKPLTQRKTTREIDFRAVFLFWGQRKLLYANLCAWVSAAGKRTFFHLFE